MGGKGGKEGQVHEAIVEFCIMLLRAQESQLESVSILVMPLTEFR